MADKYIYAVARIRALEMTLMSQAVIEQLVATDSYKKAVQFIIEKGWGDSDKASMDENERLREGGLGLYGTGWRWTDVRCCDRPRNTAGDHAGCKEGR